MEGEDDENILKKEMKREKEKIKKAKQRQKQRESNILNTINYDIIT
jgi:hypothetical protein